MSTLPSIEECERAFADDDYVLGEGRDRVGFHIPGSKWVYKLDKSDGVVNTTEYLHYLKIIGSELPDTICIPEMHLLPNGAIAAEYIPGRAPNRCSWRDHELHDTDYYACWSNAVDAFVEQFDMDDSGALCNVRVVEGSNSNNRKVYIIDLGE